MILVIQSLNTDFGDTGLGDQDRASDDVQQNDYHQQQLQKQDGIFTHMPPALIALGWIFYTRLNPKAYIHMRALVRHSARRLKDVNPGYIFQGSPVRH